MNKTNPIRAALYCLLVLLTELSFTTLFAQTFEIPYHMTAFLGFAAVLTAGFAVLNAFRKRIFAVGGLIVFVIVAAVMVIFDFYEIRTAALKIYDLLHYRFTGMAPYVDEFHHDEISVALLFAIFGVIPSFAALWAFIKRSTSLTAIFLFMFYFVPTALNDKGSSATIWYVLCGFGVMMLIVFDVVRKASVKNADITMLANCIPYLAVCLVLAMIFPMGSYTKDKDAFKLYNKTIVKIDKMLGTDFKRRIAQMRGESTALDDLKDKIESALSADVTTTNLSNEGPKTLNPDVIVCNLRLTPNEGVELGDIGDIYVRKCSMSTFDGSSWARNDEVPEFTDEEEPFTPDSYPSSGVLYIDIYGMGFGYLAPVPNNQNATIISDYSAFDGMPVKVIVEETHDFVSQVGLNYRYPESLTADEIYTYQDVEYRVSYQIRSTNDPGMPVPEWSEEYLDYVSEECTFVPDSTRNSILEKDVLPDWYMSVLNGETEMSDADKVASVMNYVHSAKPYSLKTDYAPEGEDFVAWFLSESKTGYCVHFASSAAVLLRMLGVPTRYVTGYSAGSPSSFGPIVYSTIVTDSEIEETIVYDNSYFVKSITEDDAHAWCEYFDPEYGWVGFDPTSNSFIDGYRPYTPGNVVTDKVTPAVPVEVVPHETAAEEATVTPTPVEEPQLEVSILFTNKPLVIGLLFILALLLARVGYTLFWRYKFSRGSNNSRIRAYRRYSNLLAGSKRAVPTKMHYLTNVAMFSQEGASDEDVETMRTLTREFVKGATASKPLPGRILDKVIFSVWL